MEKNFKRQDIQKKGYYLAKSVFDLTNCFDSEEMKGLVSQMRNTAMAIPANIAEGTSRKTDKKKTSYFVVARGFLNKLDTHVERSHAIGMIDTYYYKDLETQIHSIDSLLAGLIRGRKTIVR